MWSAKKKEIKEAWGTWLRRSRLRDNKQYLQNGGGRNPSEGRPIKSKQTDLVIPLPCFHKKRESKKVTLAPQKKLLSEFAKFQL